MAIRRTWRDLVLPLLMHGDAAFAGQGVVAECFALSDLKGYRTGGSIISSSHTRSASPPTPRYSRSSPYPSDVAKMIDRAIFHVNGDDPEAVVFAAKVAIEFRQKFHKPSSSTCSAIAGMATTRATSRHSPAGDVQADRLGIRPRWRSMPSGLVAEGVMTEGEVEKAKADWRARLDAELEAGSGYKPNKADGSTQNGPPSSRRTRKRTPAAARHRASMSRCFGISAARSPR